MTEEAKQFLARAVRACEKAGVFLDRGASSFAAGRAYYAMLYSARALVAECGVRARKHGEICTALAEHYTRPGRLPSEFHACLRAALERRARGTDGGEAVTLDEAEHLVAGAREFVGAARRLLGAGG